jgi:hypothetical protein
METAGQGLTCSYAVRVMKSQCQKLLKDYFQRYRREDPKRGNTPYRGRPRAFICVSVIHDESTAANDNIPLEKLKTQREKHFYVILFFFK